MTDSSQSLFDRAQRHIPGGVNSPVRAFRSVGGTPRFIASARGARVTDVDGVEYIDYVGSWGPMIAGHAHPAVIDAVVKVAAKGLSFGAPIAAEVELAELLAKLVPSLEMVRLTSSGTEATMSALRLARGFTGRDRIVKFGGCYHGHGDSLLVKAGSGALTFGMPDSSGVPSCLAELTSVLEYNNIPHLEAFFAGMGDQVAAVIIEPVVGNMNLIAPDPAFLQCLRRLCDQHGALLIFDEVMTGFRVALGGAQSLFGIRPDLSTFGKVIGGGMPMGAFGGRRDIMQQLAPLGPVYQAGTLSGNPVAVAAGLATLALLQVDGFYDQLSAKTTRLVTGLDAAARQAGLPFAAQSVGGMFGLYFRDGLPHTYDEVMQSDRERFRRFFHAMLDKGFYFAPSAFEAGFVSSAHTEADIDTTIACASGVFAGLCPA